MSELDWTYKLDERAKTTEDNEVVESVKKNPTKREKMHAHSLEEGVLMDEEDLSIEEDARRANKSARLISC